MEEKKLVLSDGSELIWSTVSSSLHRWHPDKAVLLDEWDEISYSFETHIELFKTENGSLVQKRTPADSQWPVEYWGHPANSLDATWDLLRRRLEKTLNETGVQLLDEYALNLELA